MKTIGDIFISSDRKPSSILGRMRKSPNAQILGNDQMHLGESDETWKGFPFQARTIRHAQVFVLGEFAGFNDADSLDDFEKNMPSQTGSFLVFAWDETEHQWHVWTDRFGTLHAYHAWDGHRGALGTFAPAVAEAASQKKLDWEALTAWFSFGFFPADRTHFTDMRILRPASHYVFDQHGRLLTQARYWNWQYCPDDKRSYADTVEELGRVFHEVMQDALRDGRVAVPISGGLDSRSTLTAISSDVTRSGRVWSYSYGYAKNSVETKIARQVSRARNLPFTAYTIEPYLLDEMDRLLAYTEGYQDVTQARQMFVRDDIADHSDVLIAALWGDVWFSDMGLTPAPNISDNALLQYAIKKVRKKDGWLLDHVVPPNPGDDVESLLNGFVQNELQALQNIADPDFRIKAFKTEQWSFRWSIPPTRVFQSAAWPRKIFYDTRLTDFFLTVPSSFLVGRKLQIDFLKRFAPDLARITWQVYDANLFHYQYFNTLLLPKRAIKKVWRMLSREKVFERNWETQFLNPQGRAGLEHWLTRTGLRLHEFVAPPPLQNLLDEFYTSPTAARGYTISMLLTFSAWLEKWDN
ncbi:MAG TPA: asparagine synthase-related protein [Anaerolineales bacterium]